MPTSGRRFLGVDIFTLGGTSTWFPIHRGEGDLLVPPSGGRFVRIGLDMSAFLFDHFFEMIPESMQCNI